MSDAGRGRSGLVVALAASLVANLALWRWPAAVPADEAAALPARGQSRRPVGPPRLAAAPAPAAAASCPGATVRAHELETLTRAVARREPYDRRYQEGQPDPAAARWLDQHVGPRLAPPQPGTRITSDCRASVCRIDVAPGPGADRRWLVDALGPFDTQMSRSDGGALVRYLQVPDGDAEDGGSILARFAAGFGWDAARQSCEREGPLPAVVTVRLAVERNGDGDAYFRVSLAEGRRAMASPAAACLLWMVSSALDREPLAAATTRAQLEHPVPLPSAR